MKDLEKTLRSIIKSPKYVSRLIVQGVAIGIFAGLVVCLYRFLLTSSESILQNILIAIKGNWYLILGWFVILAIMGYVTGKLMDWEPLAKGSGVPQLDAEVKGFLNPSYWRVLIAKTIGGTLSTFGGLSLGREGPSVQLGGMAAKGVCKFFKGSRTDEHRSIITGAAAGLAATFNTPLAGLLFSLEEINKSFDKTLVFVGLIAVIIADFISKLLFGQSTIFNFPCPNIPINDYWLFVVLGIVVGILGYIYNKGMIAGNDFSNKLNIRIEVKLMITFVVVGIVSLFIPQILDGGHIMIETLYVAMPPLTIIIFLFIAKYLLGVFCFSSGAPGGIFFPLLVIGAYIGAAFGCFFVPLCGLNNYMVYKFIVIAMAGFFTATIRSPITGIVLIAEMTGSTETLVASLIVCVIAYAIPTLLNNEPIYESLSDRILNNNKPKKDKSSRHILKEYVVPHDSHLIGKMIEEIPLPNNSIIISIRRGQEFLIAKNNIKIQYADQIFILIDSVDYPFENKEISFLFKQ